MNQFFYHLFPQLAADETRSIILQEENGDGFEKYSFVEAYCTDPTCHCRRVMFNVVKDDEHTVAAISYGFDPGPMQGPFLDPLNPQSDEAEEVLCMAKDLLLSDEAYLRRLERHYLLVKASCPGPENAKEAKLALWRQKKLKRQARKKQRQNRK